MQRDETRRDTNYVMKSSAAPPPTVGLSLSEHFNCSHCKLWPSQSSNQMSNESYDESVLNAFNYAASEGSPDSLSIHAHQSTWQLLHHTSFICMACNAARRRDRVSITQVGYLSMTTVYYVYALVISAIADWFMPKTARFAYAHIACVCICMYVLAYNDRFTCLINDKPAQTSREQFTQLSLSMDMNGSA